MFDPTAENLLRSQLAPITGLPCWHVSRGYGSFLTMEFGEPRLDIREPSPQSLNKARARRVITVRGSRHLRVEQCAWKISEGLGDVASSESPRDEIARALELIDGQALREFRHNPAEGTCTLVFEHRVALGLRRYEDWTRDDQLLSLAGPEMVLTVCASGQLYLGPPDNPRQNGMKGERVKLALSFG